MSANRPFVLTIAGFDPSGGAGVLADVKTFEQHRVYGFAIATGNTIQTEKECFQLQWTDLAFVLKSLEKLFQNYSIQAVKIGIIPSLNYLKEIVLKIKTLAPKTKIVWDPVLKSSSAFHFTTIENQAVLIEILKEINLITPNYDEIFQLSSKKINAGAIAVHLSTHCAVLLKGGHHPTEKGADYLYQQHEVFRLSPKAALVFDKHGSGCIVSSAITANLALQQDLKTACSNAKIYIENYLQSHPTKLGYHHV